MEKTLDEVDVEFRRLEEKLNEIEENLSGLLECSLNNVEAKTTQCEKENRSIISV